MSYRVEKAERMMAAAEAANAGGHWESAVSRAYYAVYHLVVELLAENAGFMWGAGSTIRW